MEERNTVSRPQQSRARKMVIASMLGAISTVLMMLEFSVPVMPGFIKLDISEFPALLASFALGPAYGVAVCFIKNLIHLFVTTTVGVGELSNFLLGVAFVVPAGIAYNRSRTRKGALIGAVVGAVAMAVLSLPINLFITYPFFAQLFIPMETIIAMYTALLPSVNTLPMALVIFNLPFTFVKGLINVLIVFLIYKRLSPILHK